MARTSKQYKHSWAAHPVVVWSETLACGHVKSHIQIDRVEKFSAHRRCTNCLAITLALPPKKPVQSVKLADLEISPKKEGIL